MVTRRAPGARHRPPLYQRNVEGVCTVSSLDFLSLKLAWGILGTGSIARTLAAAISRSKTGALVAVGSRSQKSANEFGDKFSVPRRHATYEALLADPDVQI